MLRPSTPIAYTLKWTAIYCMVWAAVIHGIAVPRHFEEWPAAGLFFLVMTVGQMFSAVSIAAGLRTYPSIIAFNAGIVAVYVVSRTLGLPFGEVEAIGPPDLIATIFEVVAIAALLSVAARKMLRQPTTNDNG